MSTPTAYVYYSQHYQQGSVWWHLLQISCSEHQKEHTRSSHTWHFCFVDQYWLLTICADDRLVRHLCQPDLLESWSIATNSPLSHLNLQYFKDYLLLSGWSPSMTLPAWIKYICYSLGQPIDLWITNIHAKVKIRSKWVAYYSHFQVSDIMSLLAFYKVFFGDE